MAKTLTVESTIEVIPSPRKSSFAEDVSNDAESVSYHHLLDVNLQVFGSVTEAAVNVLRRARGRDRGTSVFTCNVDHLMVMSQNDAFRAAYGRADVVTIDGAPLALLSKWTGTSDARRVTGVALTEALAAQAEKDQLKIALVGGAPGRGELAANCLRRQFPELPDLLVDSPKMGFTAGDDEDRRLIRALQTYGPDIIIVCLGAPKQELWIDQHRADLPGSVLVGAGATIDFLSGHQARAPRVFQATGTEAVYRLVTDFRRLWRRYLLRDTRFVMLFASIMLCHAFTRANIGGSRRSHTVLATHSSELSPSVCRSCQPTVARAA